MISLDEIQLRTIAAETLRTLHADDSVAVLDIHVLSDGAWSINFADRWPDTRFPTFAIEIEHNWSREAAARELQMVLREKLSICPRCQRRAWMRRVVDANVYRVECQQCGRYEIDSEELRGARS
jgi:hypothetical protein